MRTKLLLLFVFVVAMCPWFMAALDHSADNYQDTFGNGYAFSGHPTKDHALKWAVDIEEGVYQDTASGSGPSPTLWADCPWSEYSNAVGGITFFNDYVNRLGGGQQVLTGTSTTEIADWIQTEVTSGETARSEVAGGVLRVSSEGHANTDDGLTVMYRATPFIPADGKTIWFEARVAMTDIDAGAGAEDQFFIGLADTITDALPSGVVDDTVDKIGFYHDDGETTETLCFITADGDAEEITTGAATGLADGTFVKLGFKCTMSGTDQVVTPYVNGVAGTAHTTESKLPDGTGMGVCLAAVSEGTTTALLDVDWVRVAQIK